MPDHTIDEARGQAIKTARYFGNVLASHRTSFLAVHVEGVTFVVARGGGSDKLMASLRDGRALGKKAQIQGPSAEQLAAVRVEAPTSVLIALYHEPGDSSFGRQGNIHLHLLDTVALKRRKRELGECLCSKKHGSNERMPKKEETTMCEECVNVAEANGLAWSLS